MWLICNNLFFVKFILFNVVRFFFSCLGFDVEIKVEVIFLFFRV